MNEEKKTCGLCGFVIKHTKGQPKNAYKYELQNSVHIACQRIHNGILEKYQLSQNAYANAVFEGLFEILPALRESKSMKDFESRKKKAEEEIENAFPNLKEKGKEKGN
jgi:hypothetical protein